MSDSVRTLFTAACEKLPETIELTANPKLPDPFTFIDGKKVTTKADWSCRRDEISQLFQRYELGSLPPKPSGFAAVYLTGNLVILAAEGDKFIQFTVKITPATGTSTSPSPAIIAIGGLSLPQPEGVARIAFNNDEIAQQNSVSSRGKGKFYDLYGSDHSASAMMAWAWGVSRVIDALEITTGHGIDVKHLAVSGCSRNGKGTFVVGAFEPRIALTIPQESGAGGAGCWRISDSMYARNINTQTAREIIQENVWLSTSFEKYVNTTAELPFDHHMLAGLIAPRALLVIDNTGIDWLGPESVWGCMKTANKVYQALGIPDAMGLSQIGNHSHCALPDSQVPDVGAFVDMFLKGQQTNTSILKTDGENELGFVDADWIDWTVPTLA